MKIVYTAIFGNYDELRPVNPEKGWRYMCFTDTDLEASGWEVVKLSGCSKKNREVKLLPHIFLPPHEVSIYHDGNIELLMHPSEIALDYNYCVMQHPERNNLMDELRKCVNLKKDDAQIMTSQVEKYFAEGYHGQGLTANGVLVRKNTAENAKFNDAWWNEVKQWSKRDQLSFGYVAWKMGFIYEKMPFLRGCKKRSHNAKP